MLFVLESDGILMISFDAGLFLDNATGTLEYRVFTPLAKEFLMAVGQSEKGGF